MPNTTGFMTALAVVVPWHNSTWKAASFELPG
jgi:hypothetical protein